MKRITLFLVLVLFAFSVSAQEYFIKAGVGAGISGVSPIVYPENMFNDSKTVFSDQLQLTIGRNYGKIQVEIGMSYLRTGGNYDVMVPFFGFINTTAFGPYLPFYEEVKYSIQNDHLMIPVIVSYSVNKNRKISFYPGAGIEAAYNFKEKFAFEGPALNDFTPHPDDNPISAILLLKFDAQYRMNKQWSVWCGVAYHQMITSLTSTDRVYNFSGIFNAGTKYNLHTSKYIAANSEKN